MTVTVSDRAIREARDEKRDPLAWAVRATMPFAMVLDTPGASSLLLFDPHTHLAAKIPSRAADWHRRFMAGEPVGALLVQLDIKPVSDR